MAMWIGPLCGKPLPTSTIPGARSPNWTAAIRKTKPTFATSAAAWTGCSSAKPEQKSPPNARAFLKTEKLNQRLGPVFQGLFHLVQELVRDGAIHDAVIVAERHVAHRADRDGIVDDNRALLNRAQPQDPNIWLAYYRHAEESAKDARVRNGERPLLNFFGPELLGAGALGEVVH